MTSNWIKDIFKTDKAVIGLVHMQPLPGDPLYDARGGMQKVIDMAKEDVLALQKGGVDGLLFTNEFSTPYLNKVEPETVAAMAYVMGALKDIIVLPYGNDCISDEMASISLASATGAIFTRGVFHGTWSTNTGLISADGGSAVRLKKRLDIPDFKLVYYLMPESSADLGCRDATTLLKSTYFLDNPDAIAISGVVAGQKPEVEDIKKFKDEYPGALVFTATGVNYDNVEQYLNITDAMFIGTSFKQNGEFRNPIDFERVRKFMEKVKSLRSKI